MSHGWRHQRTPYSGAGLEPDYEGCLGNKLKGRENILGDGQKNRQERTAGGMFRAENKLRPEELV